MRPPEMTDVRFIAECYEDWDQFSDKGPVTLTDVRNYVRRWIYRDDEKCLVWDWGILTYRIGPYKASDCDLSPGCARVDNIVVHPKERRKGRSKAMIRDLAQYLFKQGVMVVTFKTLPGPFRDKFGDEGVVTPMNFHDYFS